ncbi:MAG: C69 family dipeptidase [Bacteroidales bacterium]|nr:C69 family dipeptidase [Bacteroidales bacterium]
MKNIILFLLVFIGAIPAFSCTNILVSRGASADSATYLVYTNDGEWLYHLDRTAAADHKAGDLLEYHSLSGKTFKIHQVPHTYAIIGFQMNEHQLAIGETTFEGRLDLWDKDLPLKYWDLMRLALLRAKTAREAIEVMTSLTAIYGYGSEGESFSIADPNEAWLLEMIGTGGKGDAVWVARRVPDGYMTAHANHSRIGEFPLDDPDNCLYSDNVISLAIEKGFYDPNSNEPFRFNDAYDPPSPEHLKYTETRVWSIFRRAAPSQEFSPGYHRGKAGAKRYPLFIKPDKKLALQDVFALVRDHYEGTAFDMTKGMAAGGFGNPNRPRPLGWEIDSVAYSWERPVSTYNTAFSFVAQMRNYLPDEIGGIAWFGVDDTYTTCYFPIYCNSTEISEPFTKGDINHYSRESAWWAFNFAANFAKIRYSDMVKDIRKVQSELENQFVNQQRLIENEAVLLSKERRIDFLTNYANEMGKLVHQKWVELGDELVTKYNDGYVKDSSGRVQPKAYPKEWLEKVVEEDPEKYKIGE